MEEALVEPELLVWARKSSGLTEEQAAGKLKISIEKLLEWEGGKKRPSISQLRRISALYKRPIAVFYLSETPKTFAPLKDFRRIPGPLETRNDSQINYEVRRAEYRREVALDLYEDLDIPIPKFAYRIKLSQDPEDAGEVLRDAIGISVNEQAQWSDDYQALNAWKMGIEKLGILVFQASRIQVEDMRAFSIGKFPLPAIILNAKDLPRPRIFSVFHEMSHLMLHEPGICDIEEEYHRAADEQKVEVFCNHVAGAALMPKTSLLKDRLVDRHKGKAWDDNDLATLAKTYNTSREAVLRRLLILGRTTVDFYKERRKAFLNEYEAIRKDKKTGIVLPHVKAISNCGLGFVRLVLNGYLQEKITASDLSEFLDLRLKHLGKIQEESMRKAQKWGT
jgi:Zn-dependent peptidase ImmA (M78 family)/DNA-binding XRE family transcriptional regulator